MTELALYPGAKYRPVKGIEKDPMILPIGVVLHVAGSKGRSLFNWFNGPSKGVESHLYLTKDGKWEQYRLFNREADANYRGNSWMGRTRRLGLLSIETEGTADGIWTPDQMDEIKRALLWLRKEWDIPLKMPATYRSPGVGYHVMWGAGPGTDTWSSARGKVCPGPKRILQYKRDIVPWMHDVMHTPPPPSPKPKPHSDEFTKAWQRLLKVDDDGIFGPDTMVRDGRMRAAAMIMTGGMAFKPFNLVDVQTVLGVKPDGFVGPKTQAAMEKWVRSAQTVLGGIAVDGYFGRDTNARYWTRRKMG